MPSISDSNNKSTQQQFTQLISFPYQESRLKKLQPDPLNQQHQKCLNLMTETLKQPREIFLSQLNDIIDSEKGPITTSIKTQLEQILRSKIYLHPLLTLQQQKEFKNENFSRSVTVGELIGFFRGIKVELTGSTALCLLQGKPIPEHQDLDFVLYSDTERFGKNKQDIFHNVVNQYARQFEFDEKIKDRLCLQFVDLSFGFTFKPAVDRKKNSRKIDITIIDIKRYPVKNKSTDEKVARWDSLASSFKIRLPDQNSGFQINQLTSNAIAYLQQQGFLLFNTDMQGLDRIQKALDKHYAVSQIQPRTLQTNIVKPYYDKVDKWQQNEFKNHNKNKSDLPFITFNELLDLYQDMYREFQKGTLTESDIVSLEICLGEAGYTHLRSSSTEAKYTFDTALFRIHLLLATGKIGQAEKLFTKFLGSCTTTQSLHPQSKIWLENALQQMSLESLKLSSVERSHLIPILSEFKLGNPLQKLIQLEIIKIKTTKKEDKNESKKRLNNLRNAINQCSVADQIMIQRALIETLADEKSVADLLKICNNLERNNSHLLGTALDHLKVSTFKTMQQQFTLLKLLQRHEALEKNTLNISFDQLIQSLYEKSNNQELSELHQYVFKHKLYKQVRSPKVLELMFSKTKTIIQLHEHITLAIQLGLKFMHHNPKQAFAHLSLAVQHQPDIQLIQHYAQAAIQSKNMPQAMAFLEHHLATQAPKETLNPEYAGIFVSLIQAYTNISKIDASTLQSSVALLPQLDLELQAKTADKHLALKLISLITYFLELPYKGVQTAVIIKIENVISQLLQNNTIDESMKNRLNIAMQRSICEALKHEAELQDLDSHNETGTPTVSQTLYNTALTTFLEIEQPTASDHNHLGEIYLALKNSEKAHFHFKQAMALDPLSISNKMSKAVININEEEAYEREVKTLLKQIIDRNIQKKPISISLVLEILVMLVNKETKSLSETERQGMAILLIKQAYKAQLVQSSFRSYESHPTVLTPYQARQINAFEWVNKRLTAELKQNKDTAAMGQLMQLTQKINQELNLSTKARVYLNKIVQGEVLTPQEIKMLAIFYRFANRQNLTHNTFNDYLQLTRTNQYYIHGIEAVYKPLFFAYRVLLSGSKNSDTQIQLIRSNSIFDFNKIATLISTSPANVENTTKLLEELLVALEIMPFYIQKDETSLRQIKGFNELRTEFKDKLGEIYNANAMFIQLLLLLMQPNFNQEMYKSLQNVLDLKNLQAHRTIAKQIYTQELATETTESSFILRQYFLIKSSRLKGEDFIKVGLESNENLVAITESDLKDITQLALKKLSKSKKSQLKIVKEALALAGGK